VGPADAALFASIAPGVFDEPVRPHRLAAYLAAPGHHLVVALAGGEIVGQCAGVVHRHPDKVAELVIDEVGTAAGHRRRGIARAMVSAMLDWGYEQGCGEIWVGTEPDNGAARQLYSSLGLHQQPVIIYEGDL
jgi:GNAT superfamily N-acetyltransferase